MRFLRKFGVREIGKFPSMMLMSYFILASIVEKETFIKEEKSIISGVFYNRFKKDMKLQSDPTVVYAITLGKKKMERKLLRKDLKIKSKFNTYLIKGLPQTHLYTRNRFLNCSVKAFKK